MVRQSIFWHNQGRVGAESPNDAEEAAHVTEPIPKTVYDTFSLSKIEVRDVK